MSKIEGLLKNRTEALEKAAEEGKRRRRKEKEVSYNIKGKKLRGKLPIWQKILIILFSLIVLMAAAIYIPPLFYKEDPESSNIVLKPDTAAIKAYQTYAKNSPESDFDNDGLSNNMENQYETNIWNPDTDGDGINDYAEIYVTETSPLEISSAMLDQVKEADTEEGGSLAVPYKIDDIIFWPDDYVSKTYGSVVRTAMGYRFCHFTGWVKFPVECHAYKYINGRHYEIEHKEYENSWRIDSSAEIRLFEKELDFVYELNLPFLGTKYLEENSVTKFLGKYLPDIGGPVTCRKTATEDIDREILTTKSDISLPSITATQEERVCKNTNTLSDLAYVRDVIDNEGCVGVSLYSEDAGEAALVIYGYNVDGDLLVTDMNLNPAGKISVKESAIRMMDKDGYVNQQSWFEWSGFGFDSRKNGDRINFFTDTLSEDYVKATEEPVIPEETEIAESNEEPEISEETTSEEEQSAPSEDSAQNAEQVNNLESGGVSFGF